MQLWMENKPSKLQTVLGPPILRPQLSEKLKMEVYKSKKTIIVRSLFRL